jgi:hypothetical protein
MRHVPPKKPLAPEVLEEGAEYIRSESWCFLREWHRAYTPTLSEDTVEKAIKLAMFSGEFRWRLMMQVYDTSEVKHSGAVWFAVVVLGISGGLLYFFSLLFG